MTRQLVFVHGRAQQQKNAVALKAEWIEALGEGLAKSGLTLPISEQNVRFPFYGDTLYDLANGGSSDTVPPIVVRGPSGDDQENRFLREVLEEIRQKAGITEAQLAEVAGQEVVDRGPANWGWVQAILKAVDRFVPHGSGASIALFTRDVYQYLNNPTIRNTIDTGVKMALQPGVETVVVAHSLGTVVSYNILRQAGHLEQWKVPLYVTLGSPLAVTMIRKVLKSFAPARCPDCVSEWFNAMDEQDVVALYPLDVSHFPLEPADPSIENKQDVRNKTENRHGISGYLDDKEVAKRIYDALVL